VRNRSPIPWFVALTAVCGAASGCPGDSGPDIGQGGEATHCQAGARPFPEVPAGWSGPAALALNANPAGLPSCPASGALSLYGGLGADPASCPCSCEPDALHSCQTTLESWGDSGCATGGTAFATIMPGCSNLSTSGPVSWTPAPPSAGACVAHSPAPLLPGARWGQYAIVCPLTPAAAQPGCATQPTSFADPFCVLHTGEVSCPAGYPFDQHLYAGMADTRGCTGVCSCSAEGMSCGGNITAHSDAACGQPSGAVSFGPDACTTLASAQSFDYQPMLLGTCTPSARTPTGGVSPTELYTVCCNR